VILFTSNAAIVSRRPELHFNQLLSAIIIHEVQCCHCTGRRHVGCSLVNVAVSEIDISVVDLFYTPSERREAANTHLLTMECPLPGPCPRSQRLWRLNLHHRIRRTSRTKTNAALLVNNWLRDVGGQRRSTRRARFEIRFNNK